MRPIRVPVLAYHPMHISGNAYEENDHSALQDDLATIRRLGMRVRPLREIVGAVLAGTLHEMDRSIALTFDDGSDFDYRDIEHPHCGTQRSMLNILRDFTGTGPPIEATTFVIVSPEARQELDQKLMIGKDWWKDNWWPLAESSGVLRVESHSWDHNHDHLASTVATAHRGAFDLARFEEADAEIRIASEYLCRVRGRAGPVLFAYPYGPASDYLADEYFPNHPESCVIAAFTTAGEPIVRGADPWRLPRCVCGWHWKSPGELEKMLRECL